MPIDEIGTGFIGAIFRFVGWIFFEIIVEILINGLGYLICRPFKKVDVGGVASTVVGIAAWVAIVMSVILVFDWVSNNVDIDSCLDQGGRFNYQENMCEFE